MGNPGLHSSELQLHSIYIFLLSRNGLERQLYQACSRTTDSGCDYTEVLDLLKKGADPNSDYYVRQHGGSYPLHWACFNEDPLCVQYLIMWGASVNVTSYRKWTPLHRACYENSIDCARLLMEQHCFTGDAASLIC